MNVFLQSEGLPRGNDLYTDDLHASLDAMQSTALSTCDPDDFQPLLRRARGKGHCDGAQFDLFANDLKHGGAKPGCTFGPQPTTVPTNLTSYTSIDMPSSTSIDTLLRRARTLIANSKSGTAPP
jgi:hypothetical protein